MEPSGPVQACNGIALPFYRIFGKVTNRRKRQIGCSLLLYSRSGLEFPRFPLYCFIGEKNGDKTAGSEAIDGHSRVFGEIRKDTNTRPSLFRN
jgi:hypothetical protein